MVITETTLPFLQACCGGYLLLFLIALFFEPRGGLEVFKWTAILTGISALLAFTEDFQNMDLIAILVGSGIFWFLVTSAMFMSALAFVSIGDRAFDDTPREQRSSPKRKRTPSVEIVYGEVVEEVPRDRQLGDGVPRLTKTPYSSVWWRKRCGGIPVYDGMKYRQPGECPVSRRGHWHGRVGNDEICEDC